MHYRQPNAQTRTYTVKYPYIHDHVDILWRVFHTLTEPVPYTFVSVNRLRERTNKQLSTVDLVQDTDCTSLETLVRDTV